MDILSAPGASIGMRELPIEAGLVGQNGQPDVVEATTDNAQPALDRIPTISPAMLEAAPTDELQRKAYMVGALAATQRRESPVAPPTAFNKLLLKPRDMGWCIDAIDMPTTASPLVELIRKTMPDTVIAADRGGRIFGLAVYKVWRQRYPDVPFPTIDGKIHFGRISKTSSVEDTQSVVDHILNRSGVMAEMAQRRAEGDDRPAKVLLLDDWVASGATLLFGKYHLVKSLSGARNLQLMLGTMKGTRIRSMRHVVGNKGQFFTGAAWSDQSDQIGIKYSTGPNVDSKWGGYGVWPSPVRTPQSRALRQNLDSEIQKQVPSSPHRYVRPTKPLRSTTWQRTTHWLRRTHDRLINNSF